MLLKQELENETNRGSYLRDIMILVLAAAVLGIYLITTTVVVSKDAVSYLFMTQWMQDNPAGILAERPSGLEVLILWSHRLFYAITGNASAQGWVWVGQGLTLLCRVLAMIPLYLIGRLITNRKTSFWGCLILLLLPEPAHWGSDILREWPNLLFMACSILSVLWAVKNIRVWPYALAGLTAGAGFLIRLESIQLVLLGLLVLTLLMVNPPRPDFSRKKAVIGAVLLLAGFAVPVLIYAACSGQITTNYWKHYVKKTAPDAVVSEEAAAPAANEKPKPESDPLPPSEQEEDIPFSTEFGLTADEAPQKGGIESLSKFVYELFKDTGELLMWFFLPFWIIGMWAHLRNNATGILRWTIGALLVMGVGMIMARYFFREAIITQRWILPPVALTTFYIYTGISQVAIWAERKKMPDRQAPYKWTRILLGIGIVICLWKCFEPLGADNRVYREAARWINTHSEQDDWIYTHDKRIAFYAEVNHIQYGNVDEFSMKPYAAKFLVVPIEKQRLEDAVPGRMTFEVSFPPKKDGDEGVAIYRYKQ